MRLNNLYLIVGASGTGKSTVVDEISKQFDIPVMQSCTDRNRRFEGETGHIFLTPEVFTALEEKEPMVAYTVFDTHRYGVTASMLYDADLYVIDPYGVIYLYRHYRGARNIRVIGLNADKSTLVQRLELRDGNSKRVQHDADIFTDSVMTLICDELISTEGKSVQEVTDEVMSSIRKMEEE